MDAKAQKISLEIYGLARMIYGVGLMVALSGGYFLTEFLLKPTSFYFPLVLNQEILVLVTLAVLARSVFHIVAGIGIARLRAWVGIWLLLGWPLLGMITFGLIHAIAEDLSRQGTAIQWLQLLSWPKTFVYAALMAFDLFFMAPRIKFVNTSSMILQSDENRVGLNKIGLTLFLAVLFFVLLLFVGKPIRQGFHQSFYKKTGEASVEAGDFEQTTVDEAQAGTPKKKGKMTDASGEQPRPVLAPLEEKESPAQRLEEPVDIIVNENKGLMPYRDLIGFIAAIGLIVGLGLQVVSGPKAFSYVLLSIGFFLWIIYGISFKMVPVALAGGICLIASVLLVFKQINR